MKKLPDEVIQFLGNQNFVIVSTIDKNGNLHSSCKGIVKIKKNGKIYLLDLYKGVTYENLKRNPRISLTAVDERSFKGYCLKGRARIATSKNLDIKFNLLWEDKLTRRISQRMIKNIMEEKIDSLHPEARLPKPKYIILMQVKEIVDLRPVNLKKTYYKEST